MNIKCVTSESSQTFTSSKNWSSEINFPIQITYAWNHQALTPQSISVNVKQCKVVHYVNNNEDVRNSRVVFALCCIYGE